MEVWVTELQLDQMKPKMRELGSQREINAQAHLVACISVFFFLACFLIVLVLLLLLSWGWNPGPFAC
jgi:hypothetical protein